MWIDFESSDVFAIKILVGGVNAISGEPDSEGLATNLRRLELLRTGASVQDYVVTPEQRWLDGIATMKNHVRQFVAMPTGSGYSVEAQVTGQDLVGGLQFEITPRLAEAMPVEVEDGCLLIWVETLTEKKLSFQVQAEVTVEFLQNLIQKRVGAPPDLQRLIFRGRQLDQGKECISTSSFDRTDRTNS